MEFETNAGLALSRCHPKPGAGHSTLFKRGKQLVRHEAHIQRSRTHSIQIRVPFDTLSCQFYSPSIQDDVFAYRGAKQLRQHGAYTEVRSTTKSKSFKGTTAPDVKFS